MKKQTVFLVMASLFGRCEHALYNTAGKQGSYRTIDYITVGKMMDTAKVPHVIDVSYGSKRIVFIGCDHNRDTAHAQFNVIHQYFDRLQPEVTFNEGGQLADTLRFPTYNAAILSHGETGALKFLCDQAGIPLMNGDVPDSLEFKITLKRYHVDELLLYYMMERLVIPQLSGAYGRYPFSELYQKAVSKWFVAQGFPLTKEQQTFAYFKALYKQNTGHEFELKLSPDIEKFDYINGGDCKFCAIGRTSKMIRDSVLLGKIDEALKTHNRIMVTFGHGHALAIEPALKQLLRKH